MTHLSLPLKHRPLRLPDIVGQDHVTEPLIGSIESGRVRQAYIFAGERGTGKTSTARVFAKALNCLEHEAPTTNPCLECQSCKAVHQGDDMAVIEVDGASNNKVDDIRALKNEVGLIAMYGRFKIYIIDEAHMLTKQAFNALLKTLEEPPSHVKFILCTTELGSIPKTIQSRCQLYRFEPVPEAVIVKQLSAIMAREKVESEEGVTEALAKMSNGSLRDGLTLLDQVLNAGGKLTHGTLEKFFGKPTKKHIQSILMSLSQGNVVKTAGHVKWLASRGFGEYYVITSVIDALRELIPTRLKEPERLETILDIILELEALSRIIRSSDIPGALFEAKLLKIALKRGK